MTVRTSLLSAFSKAGAFIDERLHPDLFPFITNERNGFQDILDFIPNTTLTKTHGGRTVFDAVLNRFNEKECVDIFKALCQTMDQRVEVKELLFSAHTLETVIAKGYASLIGCLQKAGMQFTHENLLQASSLEDNASADRMIRALTPLLVGINVGESKCVGKNVAERLNLVSFKFFCECFDLCKSAVPSYADIIVSKPDACALRVEFAKYLVDNGYFDGTFDIDRAFEKGSIPAALVFLDAASEKPDLYPQAEQLQTKHLSHSLAALYENRASCGDVMRVIDHLESASTGRGYLLADVVENARKQIAEYEIDSSGTNAKFKKIESRLERLAPHRLTHPGPGASFACPAA